MLSYLKIEMDLSYKEKALIASLGVIVLIFGWYLVGAFSTLSLNPDVPGLVEIIILIVWVAAFEASIQGFLVLRNKSQLEDERDKLIEKMSYRYSYWFLCGCLCLLMGQILHADWLDYAAVLLTPNGIFHVLLLFFVLAEVLNLIVQLYYQRRGF